MGIPLVLVSPLIIGDLSGVINIQFLERIDGNNHISNVCLKICN